MAELSFVKEGSKYVCEFEVSSDFNLHLERDKGGFLFLYQRSSDGGSYDSVGDAKFAPCDSIIDYDCTALVYPKTIKIVSEVEPTYAAVTTDGEITEIKAQTKEIEVTSNGTTTVAPDAGFAYLNSVKVKTNVAGSGGGSGETIYVKAGLGEMELQDFLDLLSCANLYKEYRNSKWRIGQIAHKYVGGFEDTELYEECKAVSINLDDELYNNGVRFSVRDLIGELDFFNSLTRLTEEEFYNIA